MADDTTTLPMARSAAFKESESLAGKSTATTSTKASTTLRSFLSNGFQASNYCKFVDWIIPIFDQMLKEQNEDNEIPVFCPGITDGSFFSQPGPGSGCNSRAMNGEAVHASPRKTGVVILGGGLPKHHICNANMMRNGADYAVFINTAQEFDGSDSGARPDEAVSWGKTRGSAETVKVHCDATMAFPLMVAETFAKNHPSKS